MEKRDIAVRVPAGTPSPAPMQPLRLCPSPRRHPSLPHDAEGSRSRPGTMISVPDRGHGAEGLLHTCRSASWAVSTAAAARKAVHARQRPGHAPASGSTPIRQLVIIPTPPEKDDTRRRYRSDSRFRRLLPEFSAACAGCGKRPVQRAGAVAVRHGRTVCSRTTRSSASACCFLCDSSGRRCAQRSSDRKSVV